MITRRFERVDLIRGGLRKPRRPEWHRAIACSSHPQNGRNTTLGIKGRTVDLLPFELGAGRFVLSRADVKNAFDNRIRQWSGDGAANINGVDEKVRLNPGRKTRSI